MHKLAKLLMLLLLLISTQSRAEHLRLAVASNFTDTMREIAGRFQNQMGHKITLSFGSTGKHYAQIKNGAPFDVFFAADARRPKLLEEEGIALANSRFTYAIGKVVLWSPKSDLINGDIQVLKTATFRYLALANPKLAPYGKAAQQILQKHGVWAGLKGKMVRGENIGQTFQFVKSGNAELGFVAYSQIKRPGKPIQGSFWKPPQNLYQAIEQQAVLLKENPMARQFLSFVQGEEGRKIIRNYGYQLP